MKNILRLIIIVIIFQSCHGQQYGSSKENPDTIVIKNEVYCNYHDFKRKEVKIVDPEDVTKLFNLIKSSVPIERPVNTLKSNNGCFSIILYKNGKEIGDYRVVYTIYDGVILDGDYAQTYKNDSLERAITPYFY